MSKVVIAGAKRTAIGALLGQFTGVPTPVLGAAAIKSANDAAAAIGDHIGGNKEAFAARMTKTARALGMKNTTFKNANGLTAKGHLSTSRDMSVLGRHLFYDFPQYYNIFSRRSADVGIGKVYSTNRRFLDAYDGADGIKTGYTSAAGFNLVGSAKRGNKRIIATVFGGTSTAQRNAKVAELLDLGFGRAPGNVREEKPQPPQYLAEAPSGAPAPGSSAKTIRVAGAALVVSPRPAARPTIALPETDTDAIMAAVALAQTPKTPAPDTTEAVAAALATPAEAAEAPAIVLAEAPDALQVSPRQSGSPATAAW